MRIKLFLTLLVGEVLFILGANRLDAQIITAPSDWQSFTSVGEIVDMDFGAGSLWATSEGGVQRVNLAAGDTTKFTNTDGLSGNDVVAVTVDRHGMLWFALVDGLLNRYDPVADVWEVIDDYESEVITDLVAFGDSIYVGLDFGVSLFTIDKMEVKETYTNLGLSGGGVVEKIAARSVTLAAGNVWVATDRGIARAPLSSSNLQAPDEWEQFTTASGLPSNTINKIVLVDTVAYAATTFGVARLENGSWRRVGSITSEIKLLTRFYQNSSSETRPLLADAAGIRVLSPEDIWEPLGNSIQNVSAIATSNNGDISLGLSNGGLARLEGNQWIVRTLNAPASNVFKNLALDDQGRLWCASQVAGVHMFDGTEWRNFDRSNVLSSNDQRTVIVDRLGRIWIGSWGGGLTIFEDDGVGDFNITRFDTTGGILAGSVTPAFVLVNGLDLDNNGNIWLLNRQANNSLALVAHTAENEWVYFSTSDGLGTTLLLSVATDGFNRVFVGTQGSGVKILDHGGTIANPTDDLFNQEITARSDGILNDEITSLAVDRDGTLWIGTEFGLNFSFSGVISTAQGLITDFVNVIGIDPQNNKWVGTANGVSISRDAVSWTHFTTDNSPLVNGNIQSFAFNEQTGEVWIGTTKGLSRVQTPFTAPKADLSQLTGYPNPFIIDGFADLFRITNLAENTSVSIFTISGKLVRQFRAFTDFQGSQVPWDGRDSDGELVPSGIYVYVAYTESGVSASGKVAVIRK